MLSLIVTNFPLLSRDPIGVLGVAESLATKQASQVTSNTSTDPPVIPEKYTKEKSYPKN